MYLMARRIRAMGVKMVLSGEGADEIFGGYLYFHKAPNPRGVPRGDRAQARRACTCTTACAPTSRWRPGASRRACRSSTWSSSTSRWRSIPRTRWRGGGGRIEKQVLREAFADIAARARSCGGRRSSSPTASATAGSTRSRRTPRPAVSDAEIAAGARALPAQPAGHQGGVLLPRDLREHFPLASAAMTVPGGKSIACRTPEALAWDAAFAASADPSGRAVVGVHVAAI